MAGEGNKRGANWQDKALTTSDPKGWGEDNKTEQIGVRTIPTPVSELPRSRKRPNADIRLRVIPQLTLTGALASLVQML